MAIISTSTGLRQRQSLSRRSILRLGFGGAGTLAALGVLADRAGAADATTTVTMWRLDPSWGVPITDSSGRPRTRCRGKACHSATPNRFFFTREDAEAGRLHKCCLAQPVPVAVSVSVDEVKKHYDASRGGIDIRRGGVPAHLRTTLATSAPVAGGAASHSPGDRDPERLAFTGSDIGRQIGIGVGAVVLGASAVAGSRFVGASGETGDA